MLNFTATNGMLYFTQYRTFCIRKKLYKYINFVTDIGLMLQFKKFAKQNFIMSKMLAQS